MLMRAEEMIHLKEKALQLLRGSLKEGFDSYYQRRYKYVCPDTRQYPWQWFWDSCFHAITLSHLDVELAKNELLNLVAAQEPDGFIGHVIYWRGAGRLRYWARLQSKLAWRPHRTALIQPPILAQAVEKVYQRSQDMPFLREMLPRLVLYYRWLAANRDPDGDGLIAIISNYESGLDNSPAYDEALGLRRAPPPRAWQLLLKARGLDISNLVRGRNYSLRRIFALDRFNVEDVAVNSVYAEGLHSLARLCAVVGREQEAQGFASRASRVEEAILGKCYDRETGAFYNLYRKKELQSKALTVISLFPIILPGLPREYADEVVSRHLQNPHEFWLPYPVPSVAKSEPSFEPEPRHFPRPLLWRGPTWMNTNWFLVRGLRRHGYTETADRIVQKSVELVLREGFREFYNPITGKGMGASGFAWSTLVVDMVE